jgi:hypothetical protein
MSIIQKLGLTAGNTDAGKIFEHLFPDFTTINYESPSQYVSICWEEYKSDKSNKSNNLNGGYFELVLGTLFIREGLLPFYAQAKIAFVPNVIYDLMFYSLKNGPICFSAKTSLRERYKQADLEAIALKYVHRRAESYLITLSEKEARNVKKKIETGDVIGLNDVIVATTPAFDMLIGHLKTLDFIQPGKIDIISSEQVITAEQCRNVLNS